MKMRGCILGLLMLLMVPTSAYSQTSDILRNPDPFDVYLLCYVRAGIDPPFDKLAEQETDVQRADEFHHAAILADARKRIEARVSSLKPIKTLIINFNATFGSYDERYNEFDFDINNGTYIDVSRTSFSAIPISTRIMLVNGGDAEGWKLNPKEAQEALARNGGSRDVMLVLTLDVLDAPAPVEMATLTLNGRIKEYDVLGRIRNVKLGHVSVE